MKFFTKQEIFWEVIQKRKRLSQRGNRIYLLFFRFGRLKFALTVEPEFCSGHIQFFAMSDGFEKFTDTGYLSIFANLDGVVPRSSLLDFISMKLEGAGINLKSPLPFQPSLF